MSTAPSIAVATPSDAANVAELARVTFVDTFGHQYPPEDLAAYLGEGYAAEAYERVLRRERTRVWLARAEGEAVGYAQAGPCKLPHPEAKPSHGELQRLYVLPALKGTGLSRRLMDEAVAWLRAQFEGPLWVSVYSENHRALRFYDRYGFKKVGEYEYPVGRVRDREFILRAER